METLAPYKTIVAIAAPTLADLKIVETNWLMQGAKAFPDLVMLAQTLGEPHEFWNRSNYFIRVFNKPGMTLFYTNYETKYSPAHKAIIHREGVLVTLGDWSYGERMITGEPIFRKLVVCRLYRYGVNGHWDNVEITDKDAIYRPGKWTTNLLSHLPYAHEIHNSRHDMDEEFQRDQLAKKLFYGREDI